MERHPPCAHGSHIRRRLQRVSRRACDGLDRPIDPGLESDPNVQDLNRMVTPEGFALKTRYSELSVAVAEGLAGTTDRLLKAELTHIAESNRNSVTRATAVSKSVFPSIFAPRRDAIAQSGVSDSRC